MIAITICATKDYCYAMKEQARKVQQACSYAHQVDPVIILVTDVNNDEIKQVSRLYKSLLPGARVDVIERNYPSGLTNYQKQAQHLIAKMRNEAFSAARAAGVTHCWSLDSDVLPPINALECSMQMLDFDKGYYAVAACPYPSQGGGDFLCGRGTPRNHILPDFSPEERQLPARFAKVLELRNKQITAWENTDCSMEEALRRNKFVHKRDKLNKKAEKFPPIADIFELQSKGRWRRRGWFSQAYPAIGAGAVVPSDWCGFGCTLMNKTALDLADFSGYDGGGTEDLFVVWNKWHPRGLRIVAIPHCACDHVIRQRNPDGSQDKTSLIHCQVYHELEGEFVGHLRQHQIPFMPL